MLEKITYHTIHARIFFQGNQPRIGDNPSPSQEFACRHGADKNRVAQLIVAKDHTCDGFQGVYPAIFGTLSYRDGAVVQGSGAAVVLQTADCPVVILSHRSSGKVAVFHAGRPALTSYGHCDSCSVVENAVRALGVRDAREAACLEALVIGDICGHCFKHDHPEAEKLVAPFRRMPQKVFADPEIGALSLYQVIKHELLIRGVSEDRIRHEGPCTLETPSLASYRRDQTPLRNTTTVVLI